MKEYLLSFRGTLCRNNEVVFFENNVQALCKWNIETNEMMTLSKCVGREYFTGFDLIEYKDQIYIFSTYGQRILIWNYKKNAYEEIIGYQINDKDAVLSQCFHIDKKVYLIYQRPGLYPILEFDLDRLCFSEINCLKNELNDEGIWAPFIQRTATGFLGMNYGKNLIFYVDLILKKASVELSSDKLRLLSVGELGEKKFCSCLKDSSLFLTNGELVYKDNTECNEAYSYMNIVEDIMIVLPRFGNKLIVIKNNGTSLVPIDLGEYGKYYGEQCSKATHCFVVGNKLYLCPNQNRDIVEVVLDTESVNIIKPKIEKSIYYCWYEVQGKVWNGVFYEERFKHSEKALEEFLELFVMQ